MKVKRNKTEKQKYNFDLNENDLRGLDSMDVKTKGLKKGFKSEKWIR